MPTKPDDLLKILSATDEPVSIKELQQALKNQVPERTLRRWLNELASEGFIIALGQYKGRRYKFVKKEDKTASLEKKANIFSENSLKIIHKVQQPIFQHEPCAYNEAWLKTYIPNQSFYLSKVQRQILAENSILMFEERSADTYTKKIFNRLLIDLSYNSSRLEGNTYSQLETQQLVLEGKTAPDKLDMEKLMILNHKEAIKFLIEGINRIEIDLNTIRTMHYLLADGLVLAEAAGQIRKEPVRISATTYIPLEGEQRLKKLLDLIAKTAIKIKDPFEQSFFLLVHISYLQAFIDINKRTARLCANIPLIKNSLVPLSFNDIEQDDYISAIIAIYEYNETGPLAELYVWSYLRSCKQYQVLSEAIGIDVIHVRYRQLRRDLITKIIREKYVGSAITKLIRKIAKINVPPEDYDKFIDNVMKELEQLESFKLAGMGISQQEFNEWKKLQ